MKKLSLLAGGAMFLASVAPALAFGGWTPSPMLSANVNYAEVKSGSQSISETGNNAQVASAGVDKSWFSAANAGGAFTLQTGTANATSYSTVKANCMHVEPQMTTAKMGINANVAMVDSMALAGSTTGYNSQTSSAGASWSMHSAANAGGPGLLQTGGANTNSASTVTVNSLHVDGFGWMN